MSKYLSSIFALSILTSFAPSRAEAETVPLPCEDASDPEQTESVLLCSAYQLELTNVIRIGDLSTLGIDTNLDGKPIAATESPIYIGNTRDGADGIIIDSGANFPGGVAFRRFLGTLDAPSVVTAGTQLGYLDFRGYSGGQFFNAGSLDMVVDPAIRFVDGGLPPTKMRFAVSDGKRVFIPVEITGSGGVEINAVTPSGYFGPGALGQPRLWVNQIESKWAAIFAGQPAEGPGFALRVHTRGQTGADFLIGGSSGPETGTFKFSVRGNGDVYAGGKLVLGVTDVGATLSSLDAAVAGAQSTADQALDTAQANAAELTAFASEGSGVAIVTGANSVAIGAGSVASDANTVAIGAPGSERRLTNLAAGIAATDAVTKTQLDTGLEAANTAISAAQTTADRAEASASQAQASADRAQTTAEQAQASADQAQTTADQALAAAGQSQSGANQAQATADQALASADQAQAAAGQAQATADQAQASADQAQTTANQALGTAQTNAKELTAFASQGTANAVASGANSVALGAGSVAAAANTVSIGTVGGERRLTNLAAGTNATDAVNKQQLDAALLGAGAGDYIAVNGQGAQPSAVAPDAVAIGALAVSDGAAAIAIGRGSAAQSASAVAVGPGAAARGQRSIAVGNLANAGSDAIAIGAAASATSVTAIAVGANATATGTNALVLGNGARGNGASAVALGDNSVANGEGAVGFGSNSVSTGTGSLAFGAAATAIRVNATAIGNNSLAEAASALAVGHNAAAVGAQSTALGANTIVRHENATAIGAGAQTTAANQVTLGGAGSSVRLGDVAASTAAQVGPVQAVTVDASGTLGRQSVASAQSVQAVDTALRQVAAIGDTQFLGLQGQVNTLFDLREHDRKDFKQGIAAVAAMAAPHFPSEPGRTSYASNVAVFRGEVGFSAGIAHRFDGDFALTAGATYAGGKNTAVRAGIAGEF